MFFFNIVTEIDLSIIVGIIVSHNFNRDVIDVFTVPSTWAFSTVHWGFTVSMTIIWTVSISPFVFNKDNTLVDFTFVNLSVSIEITIRYD